MAKPVPPSNDWLLMDFIGFLACLACVQRLINGYRRAHDQFDDTAADAIATPMAFRHAYDDMLLRMGRFLPNLHRPLILRNVSSKIPLHFYGYRRFESDEIRLFWRISNERNGDEDDRNIQRENASLRQLVQCRICIRRERRVVFLPCGHLWTCEVCVQSVCPACGLKVVSRVVVKR